MATKGHQNVISQKQQDCVFVSKFHSRETFVFSAKVMFVRQHQRLIKGKHEKSLKREMSKLPFFFVVAYPFFAFDLASRTAAENKLIDFAM